MKKSRLFISLLISLLLGGCSSDAGISLNFNNGTSLTTANVKGALGEFHLDTPGDQVILDDNPTFKWTECENAINYTLEICSIDTFEHSSKSVVYYSQSNISTTSFKVTTPLKTKNINYYWRVTANNPFNNKTVGKEKYSETRSFYYASKSVGEISIPIGEADEWALHKEGSQADVSIDRNDFFGNGQDSLKISFDTEHTKRGVESSDGWVVVTKSYEMDLYGADSLFFNFYYSGNDADVLIRIIDGDGEYWYYKVLLSNNAKQTVLVKFDEFKLRTKDTIVQNEIFDHEHIQYMEICFEKSFGDGCCVVGGFKAVNFSDYGHLFIEKLNFNNIPVENWINESYNFKKTISSEGHELTLEYSTSSGFNENAKGIGSYGYGFAKIPLNCYFASGNAISLKVKYSGYNSNVKCMVRIYEEDTDRWSYEIPYSSLNSNDYTQITIPYGAFAKSEIRADGLRQFYYILQLQLGATNLYGSGTLSFKDIEIVTIPEASSNKRVVNQDGVIDNFDNYSSRADMYKCWEMSVTNKDEAVSFNTTAKFNDGVNTACGQFEYKTDMGLAAYDIYTDVKCTGKNAIKLWVKDASPVMSGNSNYDYLSKKDVAPTIVIQIVLKDNRWYRYVIDKAPCIWTEYVIPFSEFELYSGLVLETSDPVTSENVVNFAVGMQYYYYLEDGTPYPAYSSSNPVYFDNFMFTSANSLAKTDLEIELHPGSDKRTVVDTFEYSSVDTLKLHWFGLNKLEHETISLSDEVSSEGGNHSMKLTYKGASSPSYAIYPAVGDDVECKAISLDIKGDGAATVYINLYIKRGTNILQYRYTINNVEEGWNRYVIGFDPTNFYCVSSTQASAINNKDMQNLQRLTFGIVGSTNTLSAIYIDNVKFDNSVRSFLTNTVTPLD